MIWQTCKQKSDVDYFIKIVLVCLTIMGIYGIYCFLTGQNPYISLLSEIFEKQDNNEIFSEMERGNLIGKIQSLTSHPMLWSVLLCLSLFSIFVFIDSDKLAVKYSLFAILLFNLFVCNVRSGLYALVIGTVFFFTQFSIRSRLIGFAIIFILLFMSIDTSIFGKFQPFVDSIIYLNDSSKEIRGSSLEMRFAQLGGAFELWNEGGILFGNGFGWCVNYYAEYGDHPILLAFESIVYVIIIDNGVLGILLWGFLFISFFRINYLIWTKTSKQNKKEYWLINSFLISYLIFVIATGIFGFNYFLIFLTLMLLRMLLKNQNDESSIQLNN
jgi:hypothetical protein